MNTEQATKVKTLKVTRLSTMPNKNQSYAYRVENAEDDDVKQLLEDVEGVYDGQEGGKIIYSRARMGHLNRPITATIRVVEQRADGVGTGRWFVNLVDTTLEEFGDFAEKIKLAERFGIQNAAAAVGAFFNVKGKTVAAVAAPKLETAAGADQPVLENQEQ